MRVYASAYPLCKVIHRDAGKTLGVDLLECGHSKTFAINEDGYIMAGVRRRCRDCFDALPEEEKQRRLEKFKNNDKA